MNVIYFEFLFIWFYNVIVLLIYANRKNKFTLEYIPGYLYVISIIAIMFFLIKNNNVKTAYTELINGTASRYNAELNQRYEFLYQCKSDTCIVDSIKYLPTTLFAHEITTDPDIAYNQWLASFFKKKAVYLKRAELKP